VANVYVRKTLALGALALVLTACDGQEAGPTPQGGGEATSPEALSVKLDALTADQCYLSPLQQVPGGCQKYITELGSTSGMVTQVGLSSLANALSKEVGDYRGAHCDTVSVPGNPCSQALSATAATLGEIKQQVDTQVTSR
jgi:hypothetical protein